MNHAWIKPQVPSPMRAIFIKMIPSKGGTWQVNEWCSKENLGWLPLFENPKDNNKIQKVSCFITQEYCFYAKLRSGRLVCQMWNCSEMESLWLITVAISHAVHVWFNCILCTMDSFLSAMCPWGTLGVLRTLLARRLHHVRTQWAQILAFNLFSWSSTFQLRIRSNTSQNTKPVLLF